MTPINDPEARQRALALMAEAVLSGHCWRDGGATRCARCAAPVMLRMCTGGCGCIGYCDEYATPPSGGDWGRL